MPNYNAVRNLSFYEASTSPVNWGHFRVSQLLWPFAEQALQVVEAGSTAKSPVQNLRLTKEALCVKPSTPAGKTLLQVPIPGRLYEAVLDISAGPTMPFPVAAKEDAQSLLLRLCNYVYSGALVAHESFIKQLDLPQNSSNWEKSGIRYYPESNRRYGESCKGTFTRGFSGDFKLLLHTSEDVPVDRIVYVSDRPNRNIADLKLLDYDGLAKIQAGELRDSIGSWRAYAV